MWSFQTRIAHVFLGAHLADHEIDVLEWMPVAPFCLRSDALGPAPLSTSVKPMQAKGLTVLLWLQLFFACGATFLSWGPMFSGAMGTEATTHLQSELSKLQHSPGYQETPKLDSNSLSDIVTWLRTLTFDYMHLGGYCFLGGIALVILSVVELFLVYRLKRQLPTREAEPA